MVTANLLKQLKPSLIICLLTISSHVMCQELYPAHEIGITIPRPAEERVKKNALDTKRVQLKRSDSVCAVFITPINKFPGYIRKVEIQTTDSLSGQHKIKIQKKSIRKSLIEWQDITIPTVSARLDGNDNYLKRATRYQTNVKRFVEGKNGGPSVMNQWQRLATFTLPPGSRVQKMKVQTGLFKKQEYEFDSVVASASHRLPAIDDYNCVKFDRFYERKQLNGYGLENLKYFPYSPPRNKVEKKTFEVYFEKGKSTVTPEELSAIIDYLKLNNLTILRATIEGYSSIEGTKAENGKLQKERARLLLKTLQLHNNEPILNDTVLVHDGWNELQKAVCETPFEWLESLTKEALIQRLDHDATLREEIEPYLKAQRKATLTLTLSRSLSIEEIMKRLTTDFNLAANLLRNPLSIGVYQVNEKKIMGILAYADGLAKAGNISYKALGELVDNSPTPECTRVLLFYHIIKTLEEKKREHEQLDTLFRHYKWNNMFEVANINIVSLIRSTKSQEEKRIRLRQAVDVQYYTFKYIEDGLLDVSVLRRINYPNNKSFYGLLLNQHAFLYEYAKNHPIDEADSTSTESSLTRPIASLDRKYINQPEFISKLVSQDFINPMLNPITFDDSPKNDRYFFLKTLFITRDEKIREYVQTSDDMIEFDLFHFIHIQMNNWDAYSNHFYDKDIELHELHKLIRMLKSVNKRICTPVVNQLYLDYHLKALYYLSQYWNPMNNAHVKIADESLAYIANYYMTRKEKVDPILEEKIKQQLNLFYWLPSRKPSTSYYKSPTNLNVNPDHSNP